MTPRKAELRQACVIFADLVGFSTLTQSLGAEQAYAITTGCLRLLDASVRAHGGSVDKYLGDCIMAVFGYPVPLEQASRAAVQAALEMRERVAEYNRELQLELPLGVVIGVNTGSMVSGDIRGPVIREFHVLGDAVNVAARLKAKAPIDGIFVGPESYAETRDLCRYKVLEPMRFKGKSEPIPVFELLGLKDESAHGPLRHGASGHAAHIGREAELTALLHFVERLVTGRGEAWLLLGEEGIGKSRLLGELGAAAELSEVAVLDATAQRRSAPYGLLADLLAAADPDRPPERASPAEAGALRRRVEAFFPRPVLIVVDDAEWADTDSLSGLAELLELLTEQPISLLLTFGEAAQQGRELLAPLREAQPDRCHELRLDALPAVARRQLVEALVPAAELDDRTQELIEARAGGNPQRIILASFLASALHSETDEREVHKRSSDAERRRATILFADISGFTAMTEKLGAERAYPIVAGCLALLDEIARKHGGTVDKYLGDCVLALFGVPEAIEDAPRAALNAAIEMRRRVREYNQENALPLPLDVHTGINTGLGIAGDISGPLIREFAVMGDSVSVADLLKDLAPEGSIYVGAEAQRFTRESFDFRPVEPVQLRGREDRTPAFELLSQEERLYRARIGTERQVFSALVGRETEFEALRQLLAGLSQGRGAIVNLVAEAGIGKSRLVAELASSPEASELTWLEGRSLSTGQQLSFHPIADLARSWARIDDSDDEASARQRLAQRLEELLPGESDAHLPFIASVMGLRLTEEQRAQLDRIQGDALEKRIQHSVLELVRAESEARPLVVVMDDLHWADQSSVELLETILRLATEQPVLFLNVLRPGFPQTSGRILDFTQEHHPASSHRVELHPLDERASRSLLNNLFHQGDIPHTTRRLIEEKARGNPFYIEEVVRSLVDEGAVEHHEGSFRATEKIHDVAIPGTVQEVVMARVDRLESSKKQLLQVASVVGESFHREILVGVRGEEQLDAEIEELMDAEFVVPSDRLQGIEYAFKHPLIREVTYDGILETRREELHLGVGEAIEAWMPEEISGLSAMLAYHFSLGRDVERAEEYVFRAGDEAARSAASSEALQFFRQASQLYLDLHGEGGDPTKRARLQKNIARALFNRGELVEAVEAFNQAVEVLGVRVPRSPAAQGLRFARNLFAGLQHLLLTHRWRHPAASERQRELIDLMYERSMCEVTGDATRFLFDSFEVLAQLSRIELASVPRSGLMYSATSLIFTFGGISFALARRVLKVARPAVNEDDVSELFILKASGFVHDFFAGAWGADRRIAEDLLQENLGYGKTWDVLSYLLLETDQRIGQGDWAGARERIELNDKIWDQYQNDLAKSQHYYLNTRWLSERRQLPEALAEADLYYEENPEEVLHIHAFGLKGQVQVLQGDLAGAELTLERCAELMARLGELTIPPYMRSQYYRSRLLLDVTRLEAAAAEGDGAARRQHRRLARKSLRRALRTSAWVAARQPEVFRLAGQYHGLCGRRRSARSWLQRSIDTSLQLGTRPDLGRSWRELGTQLLAANPGSEEGLGALREARDIFAELDLEWELARTPPAVT